MTQFFIGMFLGLVIGISFTLWAKNEIANGRKPSETIINFVKKQVEQISKFIKELRNKKQTNGTSNETR